MTQDTAQMQEKSENKLSNGCRSFFFAHPKNSTMEKVRSTDEVIHEKKRKFNTTIRR
jgi:hypothetical protein